MERLQFIPR